MSVQVRPVEPGDELAAAWRLAALSFGAPAGAVTGRSEPAVLPVDQVWYGAFESSGRLLGVAREIWHDQWWGGRRVSAADVSAVAVVPEARGQGAGSALMKALLEEAHERGAAVSALYPTARHVYRRNGWETCGELRSVELPTAMLPTPRRSARSTLTVRAADPNGADKPAVAALYTQLARSRDGLLTRDRPASPDAWPAGIDGISLVEDAGTLVGYASWTRGEGYRADAILDVRDLLATTPEAAGELFGVLAGWRSVTPTVRIRPLGFDAVTPLLPVETATRFDGRPWMHRPVDVTRAVSSRGWSSGCRGKVAFHLHDPLLPWNDGAFELDVADGEGVLLRSSVEPDLRLDIAGFGLLYCGAATPAMLLEAGFLHGPADAIGGLELLRPASPAQLLDYF